MAVTILMSHHLEVHLNFYLFLITKIGSFPMHRMGKQLVEFNLKGRSHCNPYFDGKVHVGTVIKIRMLIAIYVSRLWDVKCNYSIV